MRVSLEWLAEYVDLPSSETDRNSLFARMEMAGLAIDTIDRPGQGAGGIVAARVLEVLPHPQAERLHVVRLDAGEKGTYQVTSGADNYRPGDIVPLVVPGGSLPGGRAIEEVEIRGQVSQGMMCSAAELGLAEGPDAEAGIMILGREVAPGTDCVRLLAIDDAVLELDLTPNYAVFCQSMTGVAREVAALNGATARLPIDAAGDELMGPGSSSDRRSLATGTAGALAAVRIDAPDMCPRYSGALFDGVSIGPSPWWMQRRLKAAGVRPINNIVDVTNYVMLELGQPLHAFDFDLLQGGQVIVRRASPGERLTTLDGSERDLPEDSLVIADRERAVALAGVMGGQETEITPATRRMFLESANFLRTSVRRTSRRLGLRSEASGRFEKGVDPAGTVLAIERASQLLESIGAARRVDGVIDVVAKPGPPRQVSAAVGYLRSLIGLPVTPSEMVAVLERLGLGAQLREAAAPAEARIDVCVPTRRLDIEGPADLAEEIARGYGYDRIPAELPALPLTSTTLTPRRRSVLAVRRILLGCGLDEMVTFAYHGPSELDRLHLPAEHPWRRAIAVLNPMNEEQAQMRTSLVPNAMRVLAYNSGHGTTDIAAFEIGRVYLPASLPLADLPDEPFRVCLVMAGLAPSASGWEPGYRQAGFYDIKGVAELVLRHFGLETAEFRPARLPFMHPGRTASVVADGGELGWLGELHPDVAAEYDLRQRVYLAELDFTALLERQGPLRTFGGLPRFPAIDRDLALVLPVEVEASHVRQAVVAAGGALLEELSLFDVYEGQQVEAGHRSLAFRLRFRAPDRTLTDVEADSAIAAITAAAGEIGGRVR